MSTLPQSSPPCGWREKGHAPLPHVKTSLVRREGSLCILKHGLQASPQRPTQPVQRDHLLLFRLFVVRFKSA